MYKEESFIRGYHLYQNIWSTEVGGSIVCEKEPSNSSDRYVAAALKDNIIVGHFPRYVTITDFVIAYIEKCYHLLLCYWWKI